MSQSYALCIVAAPERILSAMKFMRVDKSMTICHDFLMRLDVESLRAFCAVVDERGFTPAATRLGMTQSAVSWKIKRLEERVDRTLLIREGGGIGLTADGRDLLAHAERILAAHDDAVDGLRRSDLTGVVRLGCNEEVAATALAEIITRFGRTHPDIRVEIRVQQSFDVTDWLDEGSIDLAVIQTIEDPMDRADDDLLLWTDQQVWVHADHIRPEPDDDIPLISSGERCIYLPQARRRLDGLGVTSHVVLECPSIVGVQAAVKAGLGVAIMNGRNVIEGMRPWCWGTEHLPLPGVDYVIRRRPDANDEPIEALRNELHRALSMHGANA